MNPFFSEDLAGGLMVHAAQSDVSRLDYSLCAQASASGANSGCNEACFVL